MFLKNETITGKTLFFVKVLFCTPHSICLIAVPWQGTFVWKRCVFNRCTVN